jgi:hypothetical protein
MNFKNGLLLLLLLLLCSCAQWQRLNQQNTSAIKKREFEPIPNTTPIHILFAEEKLPEHSVLKFTIISGLPIYSLSKFYAESYVISSIARSLGANIVQALDTKSSIRSELILYRNKELDTIEFAKTRNASTLPNYSNYAKICFCNDCERNRYCILKNASNETIGDISNKNKLEYKTSIFGKQTYMLEGFENSAIEIDVQAGQEYFIFVDKSDVTQDYRGDLRLNVVENYVGRHFYNQFVPKHKKK